MRPQSIYVFRHAWKRVLAGLVDLAGSVLFFPVRWFGRVPAAQKVRRILIVRIDHLGDVVMTRPAVQQLKRRFPQARIDWLVAREVMDLLAGDNCADRLIEFHPNWFTRKAGLVLVFHAWFKLIPVLREERYDLAFDFRGDLRSIILLFAARCRYRAGYGITGGGFLLHHCPAYPPSLHQTRVNTHLLAPLGIPEAPSGSCPFAVSAERAALLRRRFPALYEQRDLPWIAIQCGAGDSRKCWPAGHYRNLTERILQNRLANVLLTGTQGEREADPFPPYDPAAFLDLRGQTSTGDLPAVLEACALFIGNDSGPAHIAAAQDLAVLCIFSDHHDPEVWKPAARKLFLLSGDIDAITVQEVFDQMKEALNAIR